MLGKREDVIKDSLDAVNAILIIHGLNEIEAGSPAYNKMCGHIDRSLANQGGKKSVGRPKKEHKS